MKMLLEDKYGFYFDLHSQKMAGIERRNKELLLIHDYNFKPAEPRMFEANGCRNQHPRLAFLEDFCRFMERQLEETLMQHPITRVYLPYKVFHYLAQNYMSDWIDNSPDSMLEMLTKRFQCVFISIVTEQSRIVGISESLDPYKHHQRLFWELLDKGYFSHLQFS